MKPLKAKTTLKVNIATYGRRGLAVLDIKSRRKLKKKHKIKFIYKVDTYIFNEEEKTFVVKKDVETTHNLFTGLYQNSKVICKIDDLQKFLVKQMLNGYSNKTEE